MNESIARRLRAPAAALLPPLLALAGCASLSPDGGVADVGRLTEARTGHAVALQRSQADVDRAQARVRERLAVPLDAAGATEIALLDNQDLQARLAGLGVTEAALVEAGRPRDPQLSLARLAGGGALEVDRGLLVSLLDLLGAPARAEVASLRFERARYAAALAAVATARDAEQAFYEAVAARQLADYARQVQDAADAADELAQRMAEAGTLSRLDQLREQAFATEARAELARSVQRAQAAQERAARALGLDAAQLAAVQWPAQLPALPELPAVPPAGASDAATDPAEQRALDRRLDIRMARLDAAATARGLGLTDVTGYVDLLDLGWQAKAERGAPPTQGPALTLELPVYDLGAARRSGARAAYLQALHRVAAAAVDARSEVREAAAARASAYALARRYRDELVPLRERIAAETLRRYNGMLVDAFALLADAREQIAGVTAAVAAQRDFWLADVRLQHAIDGGAPLAIQSTSTQEQQP